MSATTIKRLIGVGTVTTASLMALAVPAQAAGPYETPKGFIGACNMAAAWPGYSPGEGTAVQPGGGMERAMSVNDSNGNEGMYNAIHHSGDQAC